MSMRLLVDKTLVGYAKPAVFAGYVAAEHNADKMSTYDIFDSFKPTVYIADANLLNHSVIKNIQERPDLRVCILGDKETNPEQYDKITKMFGNLYPWISKKVYGDVFDYGKSFYMSHYKNDIVCIENGPLQGVDKLVFSSDIRFKIFSPMVVDSAFYAGVIPDNLKRYFYKSSKIAISSFANSYNVILADGFPVMTCDKQVLLNELATDRTNDKKELKEKVLETATNFHILSEVLEQVGLDKEAKIIVSKIKEVLL